MWRSFFLAAWRNLGRNGINATVMIASLGLALGVVILLGLLVRNEWRFDRAVPGADKTYLLVLSGTLPGGGPFTTDKVPFETERQLGRDFGGVTTAARMIYGETRIATVDGRPVAPTRFGFLAAQVETAVVDPAFFTALPLPVRHGDLAAAVRGADTVVITESLASAYFHRTDVVGRHLTVMLLGSDFPPVNGRIGAVLRDLPPESHLKAQLFLTGGLAAQRFAALQSSDLCRGCIGSGITTYIRLKPGVAPATVANWLDAQMSRDLDLVAGLRGSRAWFALVPVSDLHRRTDIPQQTYAVPPGIFVAVSGFAGLVMIMAGGNFILLMIGQGTSRGMEIGMRTALGARRRDLVLQLVVEAVLYALASTVVAMAIVEQALPFVDRVIGRTVTVDGWRDGLVLLGLVGLLCTVGVGAGLVPALTLAARPPTQLLREPLMGARQINGRSYARTGLVAVQFAMLTALLLVSIAFYRQIALEDVPTGMDDRHVLIVADPPPDIAARIAGIPGVVAIGQSAPGAVFGLGANIGMRTVRGIGGSVAFNPVDAGFFKVYGISPLAGALGAQAPLGGQPGHVVLNMAAVKAFGLVSPAAAIGQAVRFTGRDDVTTEDDVVSGVVPDAALNAALGSLPAAYQIRSDRGALLNVRVRPGAEADVERAITGLWAVGAHAPMNAFFVADWRQTTLAPIRSLGQVLAVITAVGGVIALVGLFQLAAHTVRRRAREIALRQAFGARPWQTVCRIVWGQTLPIVLAIVVAWPIAVVLTTPWLHGFPHHVEVGPLTVLAAGAAVLGVTWVTMGLQALFVSLTWPGRVLRYE